MSSFARKTCAVLFFMVIPSLTEAQKPVPLALRQLVRSSGYIFAGTVVAVKPAPARRPNEVATMRITFQVDRGVRGVRSGQRLTIREWAGIWQAGERYRVGEHLLLFLYRPSRLGLTSSVGGPMGRVPLDAKGQIPPGYPQWKMLTEPPDFAGSPHKRGTVGRREYLQGLRRAMED
jgi:hypothetical protein